MTARTMAAPNPANLLSYRRVTQSQFLCRNRPSSLSLSLIAAPPVVKISRLPPDQTWSTFLFLSFFLLPLLLFFPFLYLPLTVSIDCPACVVFSRAISMYCNLNGNPRRVR